MNSIERLSALLRTLEIKAKQTDIDNTHLKSHRLIENNNLFSTNLFVSQSDKFCPYIDEVHRRIHEFSRLVKADKIGLSKAILMQIEQQISAISNALQSNSVMHQAAKASYDANNKVRVKKAKIKRSKQYGDFAKKIMLNSNQLYQKLSEHHEFERRLMDMVTERENALAKSKGKENAKLSAEMLALHQRLGRCRRAISGIERDIEFSEKR